MRCRALVMETCLEWTSRSARETVALGCDLGLRLRGGELICLSGPLGAGKTTLTQGIAKGLDIEEVSSPSYILVSEFQGRLPLYHIDAYRLDEEDPQVFETGIDHCLSQTGVCVIEWAERLEGWLPAEHLAIHLDHAQDGRLINLRAHGREHEPLLRELKARVPTGNRDLRR